MNRDMKVWVDKHGRRIPVETMSVSYLQNCLNFFSRMLNDGSIGSNEINFRLVQVRTELHRRGIYD